MPSGGCSTACLAVVIGVAALTAASVSASGSTKSVTGGTYVVGWESSFGWTNGFDPTGEYLGQRMRRSTAACCCGRSSATTTSPARPGNKLVPRSRDGGAEADERRHDLHVQAQERDQVRPAGQPRDHLDGRRVRDRAASRSPKDGGQYAFYYTVIKGWDAYSKGKAKTRRPASRRPNAKTIVFNLTKPTGDFTLRMSMPATAPIPKEVGKCFEGKPGNYGRDVISIGPVHDRGLGRGRRQLVQRDQADERLSTAQTATTSLVRNPNYDAVDRQQVAARELAGPLPVRRQHERRRHLQQDRRRATTRTRCRARAAR